MLTFTVVRTYSETTPESAEDGDHSDSGFVNEGEGMDFRDVMRELRDCSELSEYPAPVHAGAWASTDWYTTDYSTGTDRQESVHITHINGKPITAHQLNRLFRAAKLIK